MVDDDGATRGIALEASARSCIVIVDRRVSSREENLVSLNYIIYSDNQIMYNCHDEAGQMGGRQLTLRGDQPLLYDKPPKPPAMPRRWFLIFGLRQKRPIPPVSIRPLIVATDLSNRQICSSFFQVTWRSLLGRNRAPIVGSIRQGWAGLRDSCPKLLTKRWFPGAARAAGAATPELLRAGKAEKDGL